MNKILFEFNSTTWYMAVLDAPDVSAPRFCQGAVHVSPDDLEPRSVTIVTGQVEPVQRHQLLSDVIVALGSVA